MGRYCYFDGGLTVKFGFGIQDSRLDVAPGIKETTYQKVDSAMLEMSDADFSEEFKEYIEGVSGALPEECINHSEEEIKKNPEWEDWIWECVNPDMVTSEVTIDPIILLDWIVEQKMPIDTPDFNKYGKDDSEQLMRDMDESLKDADWTIRVWDWTLAILIYHQAVHNENSICAEYEL